MSGKKNNALRDYHLLVARGCDGFEWQIRYNRHANPVQRSQTAFASHADAIKAGEVALTTLRREATGSGGAVEPCS